MIPGPLPLYACLPCLRMHHAHLHVACHVERRAPALVSSSSNTFREAGEGMPGVWLRV